MALKITTPKSINKQSFQKKKAGCIDVFNAFLFENAELAGFYDIPKIKPVSYVPDKLISFSEAIGQKKHDPSLCVHFFEHDNKFERLWRNPRKYLPILKQYEAVVAPDYSLYEDFPTAKKIENTFRNYALGSWLQSQGLTVIPNIRLSGPESLGYALAGAPNNGTIAVGAHGCIKNLENRSRFMTELRVIVDCLAPTNIVVYGTDSYGVFEYPKTKNIPIRFFPPTTRRESKER